MIACIPSSDSLSWYPLNKKRRNITAWRNQALGTSLAMGFFLNNSLISDQVAEEQVLCQPNGEICLCVVYGCIHFIGLIFQLPSSAQTSGASSNAD